MQKNQDLFLQFVDVKRARQALSLRYFLCIFNLMQANKSLILTLFFSSPVIIAADANLLLLLTALFGASDKLWSDLYISRLCPLCRLQQRQAGRRDEEGSQGVLWRGK